MSIGFDGVEGGLVGEERVVGRVVAVDCWVEDEVGRSLDSKSRCARETLRALTKWLRVFMIHLLATMCQCCLGNIFEK